MTASDFQQTRFSLMPKSARNRSRRGSAQATGLDAGMIAGLGARPYAIAMGGSFRDCLGKGESLYTIDVETLGALEPDLIITQGLCEVCAVTEREVEAPSAGSRWRPGC